MSDTTTHDPETETTIIERLIAKDELPEDLRKSLKELSERASGKGLALVLGFADEKEDGTLQDAKLHVYGNASRAFKLMRRISQVYDDRAYEALQMNEALGLRSVIEDITEFAHQHASGQCEYQQTGTGDEGPANKAPAAEPEPAIA